MDFVELDEHVPFAEALPCSVEVPVTSMQISRVGHGQKGEKVNCLWNLCQQEDSCSELNLSSS